MNRPQQFPLTVGIVTCVANAVCVHHCHAAQLFRRVKAAAYFHAHKGSTLHCHELVTVVAESHSVIRIMYFTDQSIFVSRVLMCSTCSSYSCQPQDCFLYLVSEVTIKGRDTQKKTNTTKKSFVLFEN